MFVPLQCSKWLFKSFKILSRKLFLKLFHQPPPIDWIWSNWLGCYGMWSIPNMLLLKVLEHVYDCLCHSKPQTLNILNIERLEELDVPQNCTMMTLLPCRRVIIALGMYCLCHSQPQPSFVFGVVFLFLKDLVSFFSCLLTGLCYIVRSNVCNLITASFLNSFQVNFNCNCWEILSTSECIWDQSRFYLWNLFSLPVLDWI